MSKQLQLVFKEDIESLIPQAILFNFEELKDGIAAQLDEYKGRVYTDAQIGEAKKDRALLNKFSKFLNDTRIERERAYNKPFEEFKNKISELIGMIKEVSSEIDASIKAYETAEDEKKKEQIKEYYDFVIGQYAAYVPLEKVFNDKWLNKSYSAEQIHEDVDNIVANIENAMTAIKALNSDDEADLIAYFFDTLNLAKTIERNASMREKRAAAKALTDSKSGAISPLSTEKPKNGDITVRFEVTASGAKLKALKAFLIENEINYKAI